MDCILAIVVLVYAQCQCAARLLIISLIWEGDLDVEEADYKETLSLSSASGIMVSEPGNRRGVFLCTYFLGIGGINT
jgi:hypothetical protein